MRDSSVFYLNKLTSASKILNRINRVAYFFSPNFTQNKKPIYHGLTQVDVKSTLMSFWKEILKSCTLWPRLKRKAYQGKCTTLSYFLIFPEILLTGLWILSSLLLDADKLMHKL